MKKWKKYSYSEILSEQYRMRDKYNELAEKMDIPFMYTGSAIKEENIKWFKENISCAQYLIFEEGYIIHMEDDPITDDTTIRPGSKMIAQNSSGYRSVRFSPYVNNNIGFAICP